ncbi:MAG: Protein translocase subunit SecA [Phycisphaerae bacterium]|nr:Protein translocase subunit SecA [Phycisphaerae bacterium]
MSTVPSTIWRMLAQRTARKPLPRGLDAAWDAAGGALARLAPRRARFLGEAARVLAMEKEFAELTEARLREQAGQMRELFARGRERPDDRLRAFAMVREVASRQMGMRPFLEQVACALALEAGCVAEMATGEGKTLSATMPATIAGWRGRGCHVVTVNDYLADRDAAWMAPVYRFCGLTVSAVQGPMAAPDRRHAYRCDITYCTNKEITADYLRDRLALGRLSNLSSALLARLVDGSGAGTDRLVGRGLHYAIIDEADSVLIDEAVTPLIISGDAPNAEQVEAYVQAAALAPALVEGRDYRLNQRYREVDLTAEGRRRAEGLAAGLGGVWAGARRREEMVNQALVARHFYLLEKQYVIDEGKVVIVDDFTGRLMPDRTWREGLHQAIEAKERLTVNPPKDTFARISFQRFFRMYRKLSGMTGTAAEAWREFWQIYHLPTVVIPTHRPIRRVHLPDRVFATDEARSRAVVEEVARMHQAGRPVLVGTRNVRASENLSALLTAVGLEHAVLNAVRHREEAQVVAGAGAAGRVTVATNMAGRGTDIKLGRDVAEAGGLHVIAAERNDSARVDRQLFGRSGRQGDPGSAVAMVSLTDELLARYAPRLGGLLRRRYAAADGEIDSASARRVIDAAQRRSGRVALRQRKDVLRTDDWLDEYLGFAGRET